MLFAVVFIASLPSMGQEVTQQPPLAREANSRIDGELASTLLGNPAQAYVKGDAPVTFLLNYRCIRQDGSTDSGLTDSCALGDAGAAGSGRRVSVWYNLTGGTPAAAGPNFTLLADASDSLTPWQLAFCVSPPCVGTNADPGGHDFSADNVADGQSMTLVVRVRADPSNANNQGNCSGGVTGGVYRCFDPIDTTGQSVYNLKFDTFPPQFIVNDPTNANAFKLDDNRWYLYSNENLSSKLPTLVVTVVDNATGSPIDADATRIFRAGNETTTIWNPTVVTGGRSVVYTYDYSASGGESFDDNTVTELQLVFADQVGHQVDTRGNDNLGLTVVMDVTPPVLDDSSWLRKEGIDSDQTVNDEPEEDLVRLGGNVAVRINATDVGANLDTPEEFLRVQVRLESGSMTSPAFDIPWNETLESYYSENVTIPDTWVSGLTRANVTITDPVGLTDGFVINGTVSVDVDRPVVTPIGPLDNTQAEGFQSVASIPFRVRAEDPGDDDDWNGEQTQDTDGLGIKLDGVRVHYKVGRDGPINTVRLSPQTAANTFLGTRTFNPEDEVFYHLSAVDLAGNRQTYPAASDPHILVTNETANEGRFLRLQIDQVGPVIEEARDLAYVGSGPHEFVYLITDNGVGVDKSTPRFHWRLAGGGNFREVALTEETVSLENATGAIHDTAVFRATIPTQEDGSEIQWYATARDRLENTAGLGSSASPRTSIIDVVPPTVTVTAPDTSDVSRFNITWEGTDAGSGIKDYTLQFRVAGDWFTVPTRERTTATSYEVCAATDTTYQFRVSARDQAGNERDFPPQPDASTLVDAPTSCAQAPELTVSAPTPGATLTGSTTVRYLAASTSFPDSLRIRLEAGSASGFQVIASGLDNTGTATWNTAAPQAADVCLPDGSYTLRVSATDANGLSTSAQVTPLTLQNGITNCRDRDNDGLLDEWEFLHFGNLDAAGSDDTDGDGFSNLQEMQSGTDPTDAASRPGGTAGPGGSDDEDGWDNLYLLVVLGFVGVLGTFVVGMTRRW